MSQDAKEATVHSLKDLKTRLHEIFNVVDETNAKLEFLARNKPAEPTNTEKESPVGEIATLEELHDIVDRIGRKTSNMARSTNIIVGS